MTDKEIINNEKYHTCGRCKHENTPDDKYPCISCIYGTDYRTDLWELKQQNDESVNVERGNQMTFEPYEDCVSRKIDEFEVKGKTAEVWIVKGKLQIRCLGVIHNFPLPSITPKEKTEWLPVSEELPKLYEEVIVTDIETIDTYVSRYVGNGYWECDNGLYQNRIIAWQPKPKPYKVESEVCE